MIMSLLRQFNYYITKQLTKTAHTLARTLFSVFIFHLIFGRKMHSTEAATTREKKTVNIFE